MKHSKVNNQIESSLYRFRKDGFCILKDIVAKQDIEIISKIIYSENELQSIERKNWTRTSIGSQNRALNQSISKVESIVKRLGKSAQFLEDALYQGVLKKILGDYLRISSDFGIITFPGNERGYWHSDWPYNQTVAAHLPVPYDNTCMHVGTIVMLTEFTLNNGGTIILPGSHKLDTNPTHLNSRTVSNDQGNEFIKGEIQIIGSAGSILIYDTRVWHAIASNKTNEPRLALAVRFAPWWLNLEVRRPGSCEADMIEAIGNGRSSRVPLLTQGEYNGLIPGVKPFYSHWKQPSQYFKNRLGTNEHQVSSFSKYDDTPVDDSLLFDLRHLRYALPITQLAIEFGLFDKLEKNPKDIKTVVDELGSTERAISIMFCILTALGLLKKLESRKYTITSLSKCYLTQESFFYRQKLLSNDDPLLVKIRKAFRSDYLAVSPLSGKLESLKIDDVNDFVMRMDSNARPIAAELCQLSLWSEVKEVMDVGGGAGTFSIAISAKHSHIKSTIVERGPVARIAKENINNLGYDKQVNVCECDILNEDFPQNVNVVLFSNIFHNWDYETCKLLAKKAYTSLIRGGTIVLNEVICDYDQVDTLSAACFSVAMLLSHKGKQYSFNELEELLTFAGFTNLKLESGFGRYSFLTALKP